MSDMETLALKGTAVAKGGEADRVKVWDPFVRVFHWSLALGIALAWLTGDELEKPHVSLGYAIMGLIGMRILWGFIGPRHARFSAFVHSPRRVLAYLRQLPTGRAKRHLGHNPAGGAMIVALLILIAATGLTGWMMTTDAFFGAGWLEELHEGLATAILAFVGIHVLGVLHASLMHKENLVRAMFTGYKRR